MSLPVFLSAYDPSDLPAASIDPLGFERGYLALADQLLPGLTNVANRPRYFSVLCAGIHLAGIDAGSPPALRYRVRQDAALRIERFWGLANVFAATEERPLDGIRGITYVQSKRQQLEAAGARTTDADYKLLLRQATYGMVGIYATVASRLRFVDRKTFDLTPDLGQRLAEAFIAETEMPPKLRMAIASGGEVPLARLREWGERAHISAPLASDEGKLVFEAATSDPTRRRMLGLLASNPVRSGEPELAHLARLAASLEGITADANLRAWLLTVHAFEEVYRNVLLAFEHILSRAHNTILVDDLVTSAVLRGVQDRLPHGVKRLETLLADRPREVTDRLRDVCEFLAAAAAARDIHELLAILLERHAAVQHSKHDRGRRKGSWLEWSGDRIGLTLTRVGRVTEGATEPEDIPAHEFRSWAGMQLIRATAQARAA